MEPVTPKQRSPEETIDDELDDQRPTRAIATPAPLQPVHGPEVELGPGTILGDYRVRSKLGAGGMGDVFEGVHELIGKRAAIKVLKSELCADQFSIERFIAEARVVNQIGHPNIVDVFAFGQTPDGRSFLVMELLEGETLRDRIARGPIALAELCEIVRPLVRALIAAHAQGVVHRDLKPDNVFLVAVPGERADVKLLDFGIAKLVHTDKQMQQTASGALVGTPMYIAPEQARAGTIDHRADIYTLGGILFEMVTGRPPFVAATSFEVVAKHLMEPPEHPGSFAKIPPELDELIIEMLAKAPEARPTLVEVTRVLDALANPHRTAPIMFERESFHSLAVTERRTPQPVPAAPTARTQVRRGGLAIGIGIAALAIGAVAIFEIATRGSATAPPSDASIRMEPTVTPILAPAPPPDAAELRDGPPPDAHRTARPTTAAPPQPQPHSPPRSAPTGSATPADDALLPRNSTSR